MRSSIESMTLEHDVTSPDDRDPTDDVDPTGIRDLLRALPDPGPMPEGLVARISASIAQEHAALAVATASPPPQRWHYQRTRALVAAAVLAAFVGLGAIVTSGMPGAVVAAVSGASGSDTAGGSAGGSVPEAASGREGVAGAAPETGGAHGPGSGQQGSSGDTVPITASGHEWTLESLAASASDLLEHRTGAPSVAPDSADPDLGAVASAAGARACAHALGLSADGGVAIDLTTHAGAPAAALVVRDAAGLVQVAIVERACRPGHPGLLAGPRAAS